MSEPIGEALPPPDLRLRGDPPRVMRLSRKALAILGLLAGATIGGASLYALQPPRKAATEELYNTDGRATADALNSAPKDYGQVPKLGPPLPGDLGRPIVSAQQRGTEIAPSPIGRAAPLPNRDAGAANVALEARQRAQQERARARASKLFLGGSGQQPSPSDGGAVAGGQPIRPIPSAGASAPAATAGEDDQARKRAFVARDAERRTVSVNGLVTPASPYVLQAGSVIPATLITGIRSDLPGQISAQVTANVYDSPTGRLLLIPQGARLIGEYDSSVAFGQRRVLLVWNRLILPDGQSVVLERQPGTDARGYAGLMDKVNEHWGGVARAALLSTVLGIGAQLGGSGDDALIRAIRQGTSDTINQAGQQIVGRQLSVQPTLMIRPGYPVRLVVTRDLILAPVSEGER